MRPFLGFGEVVLTAAQNDVALVIYVIIDYLYQSELFGLAVRNGHHVDAERAFEVGVFIERGERLFVVSLLFEFDDRAHAVSVRFVHHVRYADENILFSSFRSTIFFSSVALLT